MKEAWNVSASNCNSLFTSKETVRSTHSTEELMTLSDVYTFIHDFNDASRITLVSLIFLCLTYSYFAIECLLFPASILVVAMEIPGEMRKGMWGIVGGNDEAKGEWIIAEVKKEKRKRKKNQFFSHPCFASARVLYSLFVLYSFVRFVEGFFVWLPWLQILCLSCKKLPYLMKDNKKDV